VREAGIEEFQDEVNQIKTLAKPPDIKSDIQEELKKIDNGLSAWTSPTPPKNPNINAEDDLADHPTDHSGE
jgi:hypothetical protein